MMNHLAVLPAILTLALAAHASAAEPDWGLVTKTPGWQARDSQAEFVYRDRMWIIGGWFDSHHAPPRDAWSSTDGRTWQLVARAVPWIHSDLPMAVVFQDRMWVMGGWYNGRLPGHSASNQVWSSVDGADWRQETAAAGWSPRLAAGLVEFNGRMWILGGIEDYYFGTPQNLKNDVWSSADGRTWRRETAAAGWAPRAYHQAVVLGERIYVLGGGNYVPNYQAYNDVWSSADGVQWKCETPSAPWHARLWFSAAVYRGRMWVLGGWSNNPSQNWGDVWHSADGRTWHRLETKTGWKERHEHSVFVFHDKLWVAGGHARPLSSEVWSLELPASFPAPD